MTAQNTKTKRIVSGPELAGRIAKNILEWAYSLVKVPSMIAGGFVILGGRLLMAATGSNQPIELKATDGPVDCVIYGLMIGSFGYSAYQWAEVLPALTGVEVTGFLRYLGGALGSGFTQIIQARALRRDWLPIKAAMAKNYSQYARIQDSEMDRLVDAARIRAKEYNSAEVRRIGFMGLIAITSWLIEFFVQFYGTQIPSNWLSFGLIGAVLQALFFTAFFELLVMLQEDRERNA